jgi:hypothetical protein
MNQKRILPYIIIPYFLTPSFFPFKPSQTDRRTDFNTPCYLSSFFFPVSARGPTRRRNSTGLAELWGGWPIELEVPTTNMLEWVHTTYKHQNDLLCACMHAQEPTLLLFKQANACCMNRSIASTLPEYVKI